MPMVAVAKTSLSGTLPASFRVNGARLPARLNYRSRRALAVSNKLVLQPTGTGATGHLETEVTLPPRLELSEGLFELGREPPADLVVPVPTVSGRHAIIKVEGGKVTLTDLNSTNGTYLGFEDTQVQLPPMQATPVRVGEEVIFGDMFLAKFQLMDVPEVAEEEAVDVQAV